MYTLIAAILAPAIGFGISCFFWARILRKSNSLGDEYGDAEEYTTRIEFKYRMDRMKKSVREGFIASYYHRSETGYMEPVNSEEAHLLSEKDLENLKKPVKTNNTSLLGQEQYDFDEELPPIDKPIFKPLE